MAGEEMSFVSDLDENSAEAQSLAQQKHGQKQAHAATTCWRAATLLLAQMTPNEGTPSL